MSEPTVLGAGMTRLGRLAEGPAELATAAVRSALADTGLAPGDLGIAVVANAMGGVLNDQESIRGQSWLADLGLGSVPVVNVENGCAAGSTGLHLACTAVRAGGGPAVVVGVEKMWTGDRDATLAGIEGSLPAGERAGLAERLPDGKGSLFMALNSTWANWQMAERGATPEQFAAATVVARRHASLNPLAQHQVPVTRQEVLDSRMVAPPLTRLMCSSFTDGAAAAVVGADANGGPRIRASVVSGGDGSLEYHERVSSAVQTAWGHAGIEPGDLDVVETHDATAAEGLYALECLGLFAPGAAGPAVEAGDTTFGSELVVNPSGGLIARGHPFGATGLCQVVELADQLRDRAGARQVEGARLGAAVNTGGIVKGDAATTVVHVLERA